MATKLQALMLGRRGEPLCVITKVTAAEKRKLMKYFENCEIYDIEYDCGDADANAMNKYINPGDYRLVLARDNEIDEWKKKGYDDFAFTHIVRTAKELKKYI